MATYVHRCARSTTKVVAKKGNAMARQTVIGIPKVAPAMAMTVSEESLTSSTTKFSIFCFPVVKSVQ